MDDRPPSHDWDPTALLEPDLVVPGQLECNAEPLKQGEIGLLWAVFLDGLTTYCREVSRHDTTSLAYREVHHWIFRGDSDALTSFSSLCEMFGIDARRLRRRLAKLREQPDCDLGRLLLQQAA